MTLHPRDAPIGPVPTVPYSTQYLVKVYSTLQCSNVQYRNTSERYSTCQADEDEGMLGEGLRSLVKASCASPCVRAAWYATTSKSLPWRSRRVMCSTFLHVSICRKIVKNVL